jgi:hypothetical protein
MQLIKFFIFFNFEWWLFMKWDKYSKLSESERLYWNFTFNKDIPRSNLSYALAIACLWSISLFVYYLIVSEKLTGFNQASVQFVFMTKVVATMLIVYIFDYIGSWIFYGINKYKEKKWLRGLKK